MLCFSKGQFLLLLGALLQCAAVLAADLTAVRPTFHASIAAATEAASADQSLVLLDFGAEWCGPCRVMKKNVFKAEEFLARAGAVRVVEIDTDANEKAAREYEVEALPTLVLMTADGKIVARQVGAMPLEDFLGWLEAGRQRAKLGQWEGTAPSARISEFVTKAAGDRLGPDDLSRLIAMLGESDPAERAAAAKLMSAQREEAVPPLMAALTNSYLGARIAASELLRKLAPESPEIDPWQSPVELSASLTNFQAWWAAHAKLPEPNETQKLDDAGRSSVTAALAQLRGNDPVKRTEAMSALVAQGEAALPSVRDAIKRNEKVGDHRTASLLEDVRWAILVPDAIEQRVTVRTALARGTSPERQAAALRLGRAGKGGIAALGELAGDGDALVVESAVRALSKIGGKDAIPAMAALLKVSDSNLRMTAAQALAHTKDATATKFLVSAAADTNEIVACAAIAGLEEIYSKGDIGSRRNSSAPQEVTAALKQSLSDTRWRVRATAAEATGKLGVEVLANDLKRALEDSDGFVVKSALTALRALGHAPDPQQLVAVAKRMPDMRAEAVRALAKSADDDAVKFVGDLFDAAPPGEQVTMLAALGERDRFDDSVLDDSWEPLIRKALAAQHSEVRRSGAALLSRVQNKVVVKIVGTALPDSDAAVRAEASAAVLRMTGGGRTEMEITQMEFSPEDFVPDSLRVEKRSKTNAPLVSAALSNQWHSALEKITTASSEPLVAAARFVTGRDTADLDTLASAWRTIDTRTAQKLIQCSALTQIIPMLTWPAGRPVIDALEASPHLYAMAASWSAQAPRVLQDHIVEPERFVRVVSPANSDEISAALMTLMRRATNKWSLVGSNESSRKVIAHLLNSTNVGWRAAAVYVTGKNDGARASNILAQAAHDRDPWVRLAAVQSLARTAADRPQLEERIGAYVSDPAEEVASVAASLLLEPEVRRSAGLDWAADGFRFGNVTLPGSTSYSGDDERPLSLVETAPPYLSAAAQRAATNAFDAALPYALLLAQHGKFEAIGALILQYPEPRSDEDTYRASGLLTAIALSRDAKYVGFVRMVAEATKEEYRLRSLLKFIKGMTGPEARQLRLDINKRMRRIPE